MFEEYLLYIKAKCPFCIKAVEKLESEDLPSVIIEIDDCPEKFKSSLKEAYNHPSFPMVFGVSRDSGSYVWIGGCDSLMEHLDKS